MINQHTQKKTWIPCSFFFSPATGVLVDRPFIYLYLRSSMPVVATNLPVSMAFFAILYCLVKMQKAKSLLISWFITPSFNNTFPYIFIVSTFSIFWPLFLPVPFDSCPGSALFPKGNTSVKILLLGRLSAELRVFSNSLSDLFLRACICSLC